ncbi:putative RNA-binding, CRM domain, YhbY-like superfamily [Helianthus annuus]|nr:putative RNA-binding, CRM domain, YhbY-like superfamily [Helianthus annuus]KAJ0830579.1 putative RNA-binding, CRM domain, YhbY-like superfamily [Helianthus annuus]
MLLQQPSPSPKTLTKPLFPHNHLPKHLLPLFPYHNRRTSFILRASASASAADSKTLPQSAIRRIADKLRSLGYVEDTADDNNKQQTLTTSPGEIFVPLPDRIPKHRVGHTLDPSWSTPENPVPEPGSGTAIRRYHELRREVWKEKKEEKVKRRMEGSTETEKVPTMAELKLAPDELRRLRSLGIAIKTRLKIGKAGITEGIVNGIHERWGRTELVKIVCEDLCRLNMKRTHDLLESKTGGLVIWRAGSIIILYRGADYKYPYFFINKQKPNDASADDPTSPSTDSEEGGGEESDSIGSKEMQPPLIQGVGSRTRVRFQLPGEAQLAEEADQLLDGLGPRFTDWYGYEPLPVDADLLPAVVPGYRKPFRLLPFGVKPKLTNDEMTTLRRLGRPLPCHFALGRNRKLQGLAAAILKLWEKCEIAKIAVKKGVQNTNSVLMAEELKWLTGGTLLTRDREYIVLYRGKDFLPATVSSAIEHRRDRGVDALERKKSAASSLDVQENKDKEIENPSAAVTDGIRDQKLEIAIEQRKRRSREAAIKKTSSKLSQALVDKERAEKLLEELEKKETKQQVEADKEGITEEERFMLRKVGMKMRPFLLLGRRGVFDGTVENMHLHWKYRELVRILCGETSIDEVHAIARTLESESGGVLIAVERMRKGHAIIVYRGKNYKRPASLRPQTLLNKREALKRSIEAQRRESLKLHVLKLGKNVEELKLKLATSEEISIHGQKDQNIQLEQDIISPSAEYTEPDSDLEVYKSNPTDQDNGQARELQEGAIDFSNTDDGIRASQENPANESDFTEANSDPSILSVEGPNESENHKTQITSISPDAFKLEETSSADLCVSVMRTEVPFSPANKPQVNESNGKLRRSVLLSNQERLLLRKQALKMKKRPVLAVGRSNIVSGVAKTIKTHFQKYPLAIVNIKGRAKGTSAQELVSKLEEATGAILVSQEPNKIILYRGWGATTTVTHNSNQTSGKREPNRREDIVKPIISPELISAIRIECGLQEYKVQESEAVS